MLNLFGVKMTFYMEKRGAIARLKKTLNAVPSKRCPAIAGKDVSHVVVAGQERVGRTVVGQIENGNRHKIYSECR